MDPGSNHPFFTEQQTNMMGMGMGMMGMGMMGMGMDAPPTTSPPHPSHGHSPHSPHSPHSHSPHSPHSSSHGHPHTHSPHPQDMMAFEPSDPFSFGSEIPLPALMQPSMSPHYVMHPIHPLKGLFFVFLDPFLQQQK